MKKDFANAKTTTLYDKFKWPNSVSVVPEDVFDSGVDAIVVPDGFLPPGKTEGNIFIITTIPTDVTLMQNVYQISA